MPNHSVFNVGCGRDFVVFNDQDLSMDDISAADLEKIEVAGVSALASAAWSSGCDWYFVIQSEGIFLLNVFTNRGYLCRKKSARFFEMFLDAPHGKQRKRKKAS